MVIWIGYVVDYTPAIMIRYHTVRITMAIWVVIRNRIGVVYALKDTLAMTKRVLLSGNIAWIIMAI